MKVKSLSPFSSLALDLQGLKCLLKTLNFQNLQKEGPKMYSLVPQTSRCGQV